VRRLLRDTRGATVVEYVAVTGLGLLLAGLIIVALTAQRRTWGGAMANVLDWHIAAFEGGQAGTVNIDAGFTPGLQAPPRLAPPALFAPILSVPHTLDP